jgi:hypothetical protein
VRDPREIGCRRGSTDTILNFAFQVVFGGKFIKSDDFKLVLLERESFEHGGQSIVYTDLIRLKFQLHGQDFVINKKAGQITRHFLLC